LQLFALLLRYVQFLPKMIIDEPIALGLAKLVLLLLTHALPVSKLGLQLLRGQLLDLRTAVPGERRLLPLLLGWCPHSFVGAFSNGLRLRTVGGQVILLLVTENIRDKVQ
jgi:hypothetical protein